MTAQPPAMRVRLVIWRGAPVIWLDDRGKGSTQLTPAAARALADRMAPSCVLTGEHQLVADLREAADRAVAWVSKAAAA